MMYDLILQTVAKNDGCACDDFTDAQRLSIALFYSLKMGMPTSWDKVPPRIWVEYCDSCTQCGLELEEYDTNAICVDCKEGNR